MTLVEENLAPAAQAASTEKPVIDLPEGVPPLNAFYIYVSGACNLACVHCYITPTFVPEGAGGQHVRLDHVRKAIQEAKSVGLRSAKLTGGEPTIHPQFRELVELIVGEGISMFMETNGTLMDEDLAHFIKDVGKMTFVSVSLDGANAETHEAMRRVPGCFDRALNGIHALVSAGYHPQIICTLHKGNVHQAEQMVHLAEELGCNSVKFNIIQEMGRGENFTVRAGLPVDQLWELSLHFEKHIAPTTKVRILFDMPMAFHSLRYLMNESLGRCSVLNILGLLSGGELSLCGAGAVVPELVYGHIERDNVRDVWLNSPGLIELRRLIPNELDGVCAECLHRDACLGQCVANTFHRAGRLNAPSQFCSKAAETGIFPASRLRFLPGENGGGKI
jgi:SynChlorMet cassette radical SAM/SPASM protein ScmF